MAGNRGKAFEQVFQHDLQNIKDSIVLRLPDQQSGYFGTSQNPCDFIFYHSPNMFMLECKSHEGNTFPLSNLRQYSKLIKYANVTGARVGVVLWFIDHDKIVYIPINTFKKLIADDKKSFNVKMIGEEEYKNYLIPTEKKKVFLTGDYSVLLDL